MRNAAVAVFAIAIVAAGCSASAAAPTWTFAPEVAAVKAAPAETAPAETASDPSPSPSVAPSAVVDVAGIAARAGVSLEGGTPPAAAPAKASVRIADFAFGPSTATIQAGGRVTWTNSDGDRHSVLIGGSESGRLDQGGTFSRSFANAGRFTYVCGIHTSMKGSIVVLAGSGASGTPASESTSGSPTTTGAPSADPTAPPTASPDDRDDDDADDRDDDEDHSGHGRGGDDDDEDHSGHGGGGSGHG